MHVFFVDRWQGVSGDDNYNYFSYNPCTPFEETHPDSFSTCHGVAVRRCFTNKLSTDNLACEKS